MTDDAPEMREVVEQRPTDDTRPYMKLMATFPEVAGEPCYPVEGVLYALRRYADAMHLAIEQRGSPGPVTGVSFEDEELNLHVEISFRALRHDG